MLGTYGAILNLDLHKKTCDGTAALKLSLTEVVLTNVDTPSTYILRCKRYIPSLSKIRLGLLSFNSDQCLH